MPSGRPCLVPTEKACPGEALPCGGSSTSLKWGCDGELSELDRDRILRRLAAADPVAHALHHQPPLQQERHQRSA
jgi:hypothetical protein